MDARGRILTLLLAALSSCNGPVGREFESPALGLSLKYPLFWQARDADFGAALEAISSLEGGIPEDRAAELKREFEVLGLQVALDAGKRNVLPGTHEPASVRILVSPTPSEALEAHGSCNAEAAVHEFAGRD